MEIEVNKTFLWPSVILHTNLNNAFEDLREWLIKEIDRQKTKSNYLETDNPNNTTKNGFQPSWDLLKSYDLNPKLIRERIVEPLSKQFWNSLEEFNSIKDPVNINYNSWIIDYNKGGWQNIHFHRNSEFTGIWFLDVEEQQDQYGELHLHNPNVPSYTHGLYKQVEKLRPKTDDLIIMPAWLHHSVTPTSAKRKCFVWNGFVDPVKS